MTTAERAEQIAAASAPLGLAWRPDRAQLLDLVGAELGHAEALDRFVPHGEIHSRARPLSPILHILAGNTPEAAIQTLTRGLLVGAENRVKLPGGGGAEVERFVDGLGGELRSAVEFTSDRGALAGWFDDAEAVIAFGSDQTIAEIQGQVRGDQVFIPHGHKVSIAIVDHDPDSTAAALAARDIAAHDQRGCLSPHDVYVAPALQPRSFAAGLATELAMQPPPGERSAGDEAAIDHLRRSYAFRAGSDLSVQIWQSEGNTDWTVVFEEETQFAASPLGRFVFVKPLPPELATPLAFVRNNLSSIALHPFSLDRAAALADLGAHRICALGESQNPSAYWHADGWQSLAPSSVGPTQADPRCRSTPNTSRPSPGSCAGDTATTTTSTNATRSTNCCSSSAAPRRPKAATGGRSATCGGSSRPSATSRKPRPSTSPSPSNPAA